MDRIAELVGEARLTLDTSFSRLGETVEYDPAVINAVLHTLDVALALLANLGRADRGQRMTATDDLIAKAEAVSRLWDLVLFSSGTADARQKRADVLHEAVCRMQHAIAKAQIEVSE